MNKSEVYAKTKNALISPKKVAPVMSLVRGKSLKQAKLLLHLDLTKASDLVLKTLESAEANAKHNLGMKSEELYVSEIHVSGGDVYKRGMFVGRGRFSPLLKRRSHIVVGLSKRDGAAGGRNK
jgi:large subunit ribosomal protein L22